MWKLHLIIGFIAYAELIVWTNAQYDMAIVQLHKDYKIQCIGIVVDSLWLVSYVSCMRPLLEESSCHGGNDNIFVSTYDQKKTGRVRSMKFHPDSDPPFDASDFMLIELKSRLKFSDTLSEIGLVDQIYLTDSRISNLREDIVCGGDPYIASVQHDDEKCRAIIADSYWFVTIARCVDRIIQGHGINVTDLSVITLDNKQEMAVESVIFHSSSDKTMEEKDLALIQLQTPMKLTKCSRPPQEEDFLKQIERLKQLVQK